jgi:hypothetical protein
MTDNGDIVSTNAGERGWLVIGWFTPDYRPLAQRFGLSLAMHRAPYHLFARPRLESGWNTRQKPSVVLDAMGAYPGKTLVLMDVDCVVRGDIEPVTRIAGDVGITTKARQVGARRYEDRKRVIVTASSRVVVFRPTEPARVFAQEWQRLCAKATDSGDEACMIWAYLLTGEVPYTQIDPRYAGREVSRAGADAVIVHDSVHAQTQPWSIKPMLKAIEGRLFRTGRTKAESLARIG